MELMMPSLVILLLGVAVTYFVLPNFAPPLLIIGSIIALLGAMYVHWNQFGRMEYEQATWQYNLRAYGSYVLIGVVLLGAYGFYAMNQAGETSSIPFANAVASPAMPALASPIIGGGLQSVMKTATSRISELMRRGRISTD